MASGMVPILPLTSARAWQTNHTVWLGILSGYPITNQQRGERELLIPLHPTDHFCLLPLVAGLLGLGPHVARERRSISRQHAGTRRWGDTPQSATTPPQIWRRRHDLASPLLWIPHLLGASTARRSIVTQTPPRPPLPPWARKLTFSL
jgi:hypothetical protein